MLVLLFALMSGYGGYERASAHTSVFLSGFFLCNEGLFPSSFTVGMEQFMLDNMIQSWTEHIYDVILYLNS